MAPFHVADDGLVEWQGTVNRPRPGATRAGAWPPCQTPGGFRPPRSARFRMPSSAAITMPATKVG